MHRRLPITILIALVLAGCAAEQGTPLPTVSSPPTAVVTPSPSVAPTPSPTARPTPSAAPFAANWQSVPLASIAGVTFHDVTWTGHAFVATGTDAHDKMLFLTSTDGVTWDRRTASGPGGEASIVAAGPGGLVVVGTIDDRSTSWFSRDGISWTERRDAFHTPSGGRSRGSVSDVVARGDGWLAVGSHDPKCAGLCAPDRALVWTSANGLDWTEIPDRKAFHAGFMGAVSPDGDGFVAVGTSIETDAPIWTSPDGVAWSNVVDDGSFVGPAGPDYGVGTTGVAVRDGRAVAIGYAGLEDDSSVVFAWVSDSRDAWSRVDVPGTEPAWPVVMPTDDGFLAAGWTNDCPGGLWATSDGRAWRCDAPDPKMLGFLPVAIAGSSSIQVAVGWTEAGDTAVWYRSR